MGFRVAIWLCAKYAWTGRVFNILGIAITWPALAVVDALQWSKTSMFVLHFWLIFYWSSIYFFARTHWRFHEHVTIDLSHHLNHRWYSVGLRTICEFFQMSLARNI